MKFQKCVSNVNHLPPYLELLNPIMRYMPNFRMCFKCYLPILDCWTQSCLRYMPNSIMRYMLQLQNVFQILPPSFGLLNPIIRYMLQFQNAFQMLPSSLGPLNPIMRYMPHFLATWLQPQLQFKTLAMFTYFVMQWFCSAC